MPSATRPPTIPAAAEEADLERALLAALKTVRELSPEELVTRAAGHNPQMQALARRVIWALASEGRIAFTPDWHVVLVPQPRAAR